MDYKDQTIIFLEEKIERLQRELEAAEEEITKQKGYVWKRQVELLKFVKLHAIARSILMSFEMRKEIRPHEDSLRSILKELAE